LGANNFGHATISVGGTVNYTIAAFSGLLNPDHKSIPGIQNNAVFTVNDLGAFFNQYQNGDPSKQFEIGKRKYVGNTLKAQASILVHETAHQITVSGFQPDFSNPRAGKANDAAVDSNCRQMIEGLQ
jgi:hypothetical protein